MALNEEEYNILVELAFVCRTIYDNYKILSESNDQLKRESIIDDIKKLVKIEEDYYQKLDITNVKLEEIKMCFFKTEHNLSLGGLLALAKSNNEFVMIHTRIILKLQGLINKKIIEINKDEIMNFMVNPRYNKQINILTNIHKVALDNDLCNSIYYMIDSYTKDSEYKAYNSSLQSLKYNLSYLWPSVEENNLENDFQESELYWGYIMYCDIFNIPYNEVGMSTIIEMCKFFLDILLQELFGTSTKKLSEKEITYALIYLRTGLMFAPQHIIDIFKEKFNTTIVHNYAKHGNLQIEEKILEILDMNKTDKSIPKLVRFNPKYQNKEI